MRRPPVCARRGRSGDATTSWMPQSRGRSQRPASSLRESAVLSPFAQSDPVRLFLSHPLRRPFLPIPSSWIPSRTPRFSRCSRHRKPLMCVSFDRCGLEEFLSVLRMRIYVLKASTLFPWLVFTVGDFTDDGRLKKWHQIQSGTNHGSKHPCQRYESLIKQKSRLGQYFSLLLRTSCPPLVARDITSRGSSLPRAMASSNLRFWLVGDIATLGDGARVFLKF